MPHEEGVLGAQVYITPKSLTAFVVLAVCVKAISNGLRPVRKDCLEREMLHYKR